MKVSAILTDIISSSWLNFIDVITDPEYGYLLSLNPIDFGMQRTSEDTTYVTIAGDNLPIVSYTNYDTVNYAPLLFFLNSSIEHPLYLPPNTEIWIPNPTKIYGFLRDMTLSE